MRRAIRFPRLFWNLFSTIFPAQFSVIIHIWHGWSGLRPGRARMHLPKHAPPQRIPGPPSDICHFRALCAVLADPTMSLIDTGGPSHSLIAFRLDLQPRPPTKSLPAFPAAAPKARTLASRIAAVVGQTSRVQLGALGPCSSIFSVVFMCSSFLGISTTRSVARAQDAGDENTRRRRCVWGAEARRKRVAGCLGGCCRRQRVGGLMRRALTSVAQSLTVTD